MSVQNCCTAHNTCTPFHMERPIITYRSLLFWDRIKARTFFSCHLHTVGVFQMCFPGWEFVTEHVLLLILFQTKAGLVVPGGKPSLLLSPSVFQQSTTKAPELPRNPAPPPSPPASLGAGELPSTVYSKAQLQDVLIHLIKVRSFNKRTYDLFLASVCFSAMLNTFRLVSALILFRTMPTSSAQSMKHTCRASPKTSATSNYSHWPQTLGLSALLVNPEGCIFGQNYHKPSALVISLWILITEMNSKANITPFFQRYQMTT